MPAGTTSGSASRVTTIELFLDLVFVFTITQIAAGLEHDLTWAGAGRAVLLFSVLWWMYGGYIWLTNQVPPRTAAQRLLLLAGMAGFMITAVAMPHAFDGTGVWFGLGYLVVVTVHSGLFTRAPEHQGLRWLIPLNLTSAGLVLVAGAVGRGWWAYLLWGLALVVQVITPRLRVTPRFDLDADHFVERYGLLVIIALGEAVAATGLSVDAGDLSLALAGTVLLALALPAGLWWSYFSGDEEAAVTALAGVDADERGALGIRAYFYAHIPVLLGIVAATAGVREVLAEPGEPLTTAAALALAGGVALFYAGDVRFRRVLRIGRVAPRAVLVVAAAATATIGHRVSGVAQLASLLVLIGAMIVIESWLGGLERGGGR